MTKKSDLSWRIGMFMLVLCAALVLTVLPAAADYIADKPLTAYKTAEDVNGDLEYTIGNSTYSTKLMNNLSGTNLPNYYEAGFEPDIAVDASNETARLYVYWTWSFINDLNTKYNRGNIANMKVMFNGEELTEPAIYWDTKNITDYQLATHAESYNYLSGTTAYDVTGYVDATDEDRIYCVNISNADPVYDNVSTPGNDTTSFNIQAVGLLVVYNDANADSTNTYWIDEGCDMLNNKWNTSTCPGFWDYGGITPDDCVALANFTDVDLDDMDSAELITCVPSAGTIYNRLYVNYFFNYPTWQGIKYWDGLWDGSPRDSNFSWNTTDVTSNLIDDSDSAIDDTNYVGFQSGLYKMLPGAGEGQMQAANAILIIKRNAN